MKLCATLITDLHQLSELQAHWQALTDSLDGTVDFFASYAYTYAYLSHYGPPDWFVVAVHDQDSQQLQAVFPLQRFHITHETHRFTACKALGVPYLTYIDFAIHSKCRREVITFLLNGVFGPQLSIDLCLFWPLHEDSKLYLTLLEDLASHPALKTERYPNNLHHIDTRGLSFAAFVKTRPSHTFKDAAYCLRRLHRKGAVRLAAHTDPDTLYAAAKQACARNHARYGTRHALAHFADWPDFVASVASQLAPQGRAELTTLDVDGQTIAAALCFFYPFVLGWSLLEAMSLGCAIVASDTQPLREAITHNQTGRLVNFFDVAGLANEVCTLLDDPAARQRLGQNARTFAHTNYDLQTVCLPKQVAWAESLLAQA